MTTISIDDRASRRVLVRLDGSLELGMIGLGLVWLALVIASLVTTLPLVYAAVAIWGAFAAELAGRLAIATNRRQYLREHRVLVLALLVPALRCVRLGRSLRVRRAARAARGESVTRSTATAARPAASRIHQVLAARNALGYVICSALAVVLLGSAGMYWLGDFESYAQSLWWTAMLMTTMGTSTWPQDVAPRILSIMLALYGFGLLAYTTGFLASLFVARRRVHTGAAARQLA